MPVFFAEENLPQRFWSSDILTSSKTDVRGANPAESDSKAVEKMAQDALYLENEEAKWFKITRR